MLFTGALLLFFLFIGKDKDFDRDSIPEDLREGISGKSPWKAIHETPDWKICKGAKVRYCGVHARSVGEYGRVLEVFSDGACVVEWESDGKIGLYGDHLVSMKLIRD